MSSLPTLALRGSAHACSPPSAEEQSVCITNLDPQHSLLEVGATCLVRHEYYTLAPKL
jgi:hypothetical protein